MNSTLRHTEFSSARSLSYVRLLYLLDALLSRSETKFWSTFRACLASVHVRQGCTPYYDAYGVNSRSGLSWIRIMVGLKLEGTSRM